MLIFTSSACEDHVNANAPVESPRRYPAMLAGLKRAERSGAKPEYRDVRSATDEQLLRVHPQGYLDLIRQTSRANGYLDRDTAVNEHSWEATRAASGAAIGAVEGAMSGEASFAVVRPPGHHAGPDYAMGFCLTNHAAVAAAHARSLGLRRVAILDWDVHHGNGTQDIFYDRADVLYLSVHRGGIFYPGTGRAGEVGEGAGVGFTVNLPLPAGSGWDAYRDAFAGIFLPVLEEYAPEVVIVSAGYDAHAADPLGGMALDTASFQNLASSMAGLCRSVGACPPVFIAEGGYDLGSLSESVAATIEGAKGEAKTLGAECYDASRPVQEARELLSRYWESLR
ncbi:MAG: histone deacetylase family protein [Rubrobacter sp.]